MTHIAYWGDEDGPNFGDILNKNILDHYGVKYVHSRDHSVSNLFMIGSVARLARKGSIVIGSGSIRNDDLRYEGVDFRAVRGPLTRQNVIQRGGSCPQIYGDPALLLPRLVPAQEKRYKIGMTVHYQHRREDVINTIKSAGFHYIDILNHDPIAVAKEISSCERIISTSLHGIIAAHAYGIPAAHVNLRGVARLHGDGIKFKDHYAAMGLKHTCNSIDKLVFETGTLPDLNALENEIKKL